MRAKLYEIEEQKHQAAEKSVSMAEVIRECIDFYRAHTERARQLRYQKENALSAVGSFSSAKK